MSELETSEIETSAADVGADTPATETHEGFISLEKNQEEVNKQHRKFRDEERLRGTESTRADKAEKELEELRAKNAEVIIPDVPDQYSDDFAEKIVERDNAITRKAELGAEETRKIEQHNREADERKTRQDADIQKKVQAFDTHMVTLGLNPAATKEAADTVLQYGLSDNFQDILLEDPDGPLFVQYLANNPTEIEEMNGMSALQLVNHLNGDIRQKASLLKPKTSNAPDPPVTLRGGGVGEPLESWEVGGTWS